HGVVRGCPHRRLDLAVEGDDRRPAPEDRPPAPALYRRHAARLRPDLAKEVGAPLWAPETAPRTGRPRRRHEQGDRGGANGATTRVAPTLLARLRPPARCRPPAPPAPVIRFP